MFIYFLNGHWLTIKALIKIWTCFWVKISQSLWVVSICFSSWVKARTISPAANTAPRFQYIVIYRNLAYSMATRTSLPLPDVISNSLTLPVWNFLFTIICTSQSAEYDKRVTNIRFFVYIGSPGLHPNSCQAPGSSCQLLGSSHHSAVLELASRHLAYIYICLVKKYAVLSWYNLLFLFFKVSYCIFKFII